MPTKEFAGAARAAEPKSAEEKNENSLLTYYLHVHQMYVMEANERTNVYRERK